MTVVMKVGELARSTGLSVRTLHHYDDIGLLSPARRSAAGHRLYGRREVERLQRIVSLRHLGLALDEIRECLERPEYSLERVLELHVERLEEQLGRQRRLRDLVQGLRDRLRDGGETSLDELTRTIEVTMSYEKHYTPEQLEKLEARRNEVGDERIREVQREWQEIFASYTDAMRRGLDPASPEVQALARKSASLIGEFTGGDPEIASSLGNMMRNEGPEVLERQGMDMAPGLWEYMGRARAAQHGNE
ncbi:MAG: MerR family transcriptional regulator [Gemmatimonadota bacterium]|jgi:DNA-binding transcriptional MerR regulator